MRFDKEKPEKYITIFFKLAIWLIIGIGIALRLAVFIDDRDLIIDEANIVRNLYERNFLGLLKPLSYEQAAPLLFLWIEELLTLLFGYGQQVLRLYPLLAGIASLFLLRRVLLCFIPVRSAWLPIALMAFTYFNIRYATELKQYVPDQMITLLLLWLALRTDIFGDRKKFIITWVIAGSIAIWASMPAVFVLCGVGGYYGWQCLRQKDQKSFLLLLGVGLVWVAQFGAYYFLLLKQQVEWDYMIKYHEPYFLFGRPSNAMEWAHNKMRIDEIIHNLGGYRYYSYWMTIICLLLGSVYLAYKDTAKFFLVGVPIMLTILAAALNKFSLIDRVILFTVPLLLVLFGCGFELLMKPRFLPWQLFVVFVGIYMIKKYNEFKFFREKIYSHSITPLLDVLVKQNANGSDLYIHISAQASYIYYTQIHIKREKYEQLRDAHYLEWNVNYGSVLKPGNDTAYFVYCGGISAEELSIHEKEIRNKMTPFLHYQVTNGFGDVYGYHLKSAVHN